MVMGTLCKYDLRKGDLFVLSWERMRRRSVSYFFGFGMGTMLANFHMCGVMLLRSVLGASSLLSCPQTICFLIFNIYFFPIVPCLFTLNY